MVIHIPGGSDLQTNLKLQTVKVQKQIGEDALKLLHTGAKTAAISEVTDLMPKMAAQIKQSYDLLKENAITTHDAEKPHEGINIYIPDKNKKYEKIEDVISTQSDEILRQTLSQTWNPYTRKQINNEFKNIKKNLLTNVYIYKNKEVAKETDKHITSLVNAKSQQVVNFDGGNINHFINETFKDMDNLFTGLAGTNTDKERREKIIYNNFILHTMKELAEGDPTGVRNGKYNVLHQKLNDIDKQHIYALTEGKFKNAEEQVAWRNAHYKPFANNINNKEYIVNTLNGNKDFPMRFNIEFNADNYGYVKLLTDKEKVDRNMEELKPIITKMKTTTIDKIPEIIEQETDEQKKQLLNIWNNHNQQLYEKNTVDWAQFNDYILLSDPKKMISEAEIKDLIKIYNIKNVPGNKQDYLSSGQKHFLAKTLNKIKFNSSEGLVAVVKVKQDLEKNYPDSDIRDKIITDIISNNDLNPEIQSALRYFGKTAQDIVNSKIYMTQFKKNERGGKELTEMKKNFYNLNPYIGNKFEEFTKSLNELPIDNPGRIIENMKSDIYDLFFYTKNKLSSLSDEEIMDVVHNKVFSIYSINGGTIMPTTYIDGSGNKQNMSESKHQDINKNLKSIQYKIIRNMDMEKIINNMSPDLQKRFSKQITYMDKQKKYEIEAMNLPELDKKILEIRSLPKSEQKMLRHYEMQRAYQYYKISDDRLYLIDSLCKAMVFIVENNNIVVYLKFDLAKERAVDKNGREIKFDINTILNMK